MTLSCIHEICLPSVSLSLGNACRVLLSRGTGVTDGAHPECWNRGCGSQGRSCKLTFHDPLFPGNRSIRHFVLDEMGCCRPSRCRSIMHKPQTWARFWPGGNQMTNTPNLTPPNGQLSFAGMRFLRRSADFVLFCFSIFKSKNWLYNALKQLFFIPEIPKVPTVEGGLASPPPTPTPRSVATLPRRAVNSLPR